MNSTSNFSRRIGISVLLLSGAFFVAGCGKSGEPKTPGADSTKSATTSSATTPAAGATDTANKTAATADATAKPGALSPEALAGQKIFYNAKYGKVKVACAGCHADGQPTTLKDPRQRPGHTLAGVATRTSTWYGIYKGADLKKYAYGAALCAMGYQKTADVVEKAISPADIAALNAYFEAIQSGQGALATNLTSHWITKPQFHDTDPIDEKAAKAATKVVMKIPGDAGNGEAVWNKMCQYCHGMTEKKSGPSMQEAAKDIGLVARSMKVGSGAMPFYTSDILSDQQMADVVGYIQKQLAASK